MATTVLPGHLSSSQGITDESASILMELRRLPEEGGSAPPSPRDSPRTPTTPRSPGTTSPVSSNDDVQCQLSNCLLCTRGVPGLLIRSPTWASIMRVVFYCLQHDNTVKQFFNLKTDVYGFMTTHWTRLCLDKKRSDNWHKQIQDMLSHSKNLFESGMEKYRQNGFWRMKQTQDPWTIRKDKKSSSKGIKRSGELSELDSPKRRKSTSPEDGADSNDESDGGVDSADEKRGLEDEVKFLKEELKKKEQEAAENKYSYFKLLDQFKVLQQQTEALLRKHMQSSISLSPPSSAPMNPMQWDALHPQPWETAHSSTPTQQHDVVRKQLVMSANVPPTPTSPPKWEGMPSLRYSTPLRPLHFNFPLSHNTPLSNSLSVKCDDQLRLSPLATI